MATTATPSKLSTEERMLISNSLDYYLKGTNRAITMNEKYPEIKAIHQKQAARISQLLAKLSSIELDL